MAISREETVELYEKLVATQPEFKIKGKASAYTSLNGHMFSFVTKEGGLAIRLGKAEQEAFMKKHKSGPVIQYNSTMHGYVHVPESLLKRTSAAAKLFQQSIDYISSLEPKATTKPKKKTAKTAAKKKAAKKKPAKKAKAAKSTSKKASASKKKATKKKPSSKKAPAKKKTTSKKSASKKTGAAATKRKAAGKASKKATKKKAKTAKR